MTSRKMVNKTMAILACLLGLLASARAQQLIDMNELGIAQAKDATPLVFEVLQRISGKAKIVFPKGIYHFYPDQAFGKYHAVTNHDNGYMVFAFPLMGFKDLEIDGQGSEFIFHGKIVPFLLEGASGITLKNFSIDWEDPFYVQATVLETDSVRSSMKLRFSDESRVGFDDGRLWLLANGQHLTFPGEDMIFDPQTNAVAYRAEDYLFRIDRNAPLTVSPVPGTDREFAVQAAVARRLPPVGMVGIYKGNFGDNRHCPAIHIIKSASVNVADVTVYHAGGMGLIAEKTEHIHLNRFFVKLREGAGRLVTTTADATHFCNCRGELLVENCLFENMLDDAMNVHGTYLKVHSLLNQFTVLARLNHMQQTGYELLGKGDSVQVVHGTTLLPKALITVNNVQYVNDRYSRITFNQDISSILAAGDGLENISWYPALVFRNNVVRNNRARSILVSTPRKVLIENNSFSSMMTSILFEGDMSDWFESGAVRDVSVRNNLFLDAGYGGEQYPVIWINPRQKEVDPIQPFEQNIRIENNIFRTFDNLLLRAKSIDGLWFCNNTLEDSATYKPINTGSATVEITASKNVSVSGNVNNRNSKFDVKTDENK